MVCWSEGCFSPTRVQGFPKSGAKGSDILSLVDEAEDHDGKVVNDSKIASPQSAPEWKPLTAKQRRVLGTLMEKSKTTPDAYPMTFTGLCTGCNQKSNRTPISNYTSEHVETIVDELRSMGALTSVQGLGRVTKVRHYAYNWLGLSKVEAAVMTELLLRGEQTLGELRTRAARMEPINDIQHMSELFAELKRRNLVVELSPPGRGQIRWQRRVKQYRTLQSAIVNGFNKQLGVGWQVGNRN